MTKQNPLRTSSINTWCPGCFNNQILAGVEDFVKENPKLNYAICAGIGCHAKIFDYLNLPGMYGLHGRVIPMCTGMKIADPTKTVIGFSGDGDAYDEGIAHLIHAAKNNININYLVHDNQVFALTVAQPTPTSEKGYVDKTTPFGVKTQAINPLKLMLAAGATFVARVWADKQQISNVLKQAIAHKGFSFIEVMQPCIIFHPDVGYKNFSYQIKNNKSDPNEAMKLAEEFNYAEKPSETNKIPLGIFYQTQRPTFEDLVREKK